MKNAFGKALRAARLRGGYTQRDFAHLVGVSAVYLCYVERGRKPPPPALRIAEWAGLLAVDPYELTGLGGRVHDDLRQVIRDRPQLMAALLLAAYKLTATQVERLTQQARGMKG